MLNISENNTTIINWNMSRDRHWIIAITIVATGLFSAASYPTLEGWVLWSHYSQFGINWYLGNLRSLCDRPLHLLPSYIVWLIPGRYDIGCMILGGLLAVLRACLSIAIARSLNLNRASGFVFFLACVLQPYWSASGYERFHAAQTSFVIFLSALLLCTMPSGPNNHKNIAVGIIISLCGFLTYQGLFLVAIVTPMIFMVFSSRSLAYKTSLVFVPACVMYVAFHKGITHYFDDPIDPSNNHRFGPHSVIRAYATVLNSGITSLISILFTFAFLLVHSVLRREPVSKQFLIAFVMALAPFTAIIFHSSILKLNDPDRVMFPVMASIIVVIMAVCKSWETTNMLKKTTWLNILCCLVFVASFAGLISQPICFICLQNSLLRQLSQRSHLFNKDSSVQLIDNTGVFGDVYTFLPPQISYATACYGIPGKFEICTPQSVAKNHYYAKRYPLKTTPVCGEASISDYSVVLTIEFSTKKTLFGKSIVVRE